MPLTFPSVIGHRGACGYAPENTLASIRTAASLGVKWVEFDVKLTRDGIPILMHDDTLERTTNGAGLVATHSFDDLRDIDAGSWFGDSFRAERIPTLEQVVDILYELDMGMNLEIKPCPDRDIETAEVILDTLSRVWDDNDKLLISSFSYIALGVVRDTAPDYNIGMLLDTEPHPNWAEIAEHLKPQSINIDGRMPNLTRDGVELFLEHAPAVLAYTINDPMLARKLHSFGVDSVFSDVPDLILANMH